MALRGTMRPAVSISGSVKKASGGGGNASFVTDETLSFVGGVLSVNVTDQLEEGNTLPVSSAAVYAAIDPAVDAALEEAKESGEFNGAPGKTAYQYAQEGGYTGTEEDFAKKLSTEYPKKISELENDSKFITASGAPVQIVNGKTGAVTLNAGDVGARPENWMPTAAEVGALPDTYTPPNQTAEQVGADPSGTAAGKVSAHNTNTGAHGDIRLLISALTSRLDALANSDDTTLDQMAEVVEYIKDNRELIEQITTGKVSVTDIINNLTTNVSNKPLSAAQGVAIKALIDGLSSGKLDASKLTEAVNAALAQAKASGEFDGKDGAPGTSVTVKSVSESTADGGNNVVTFSDGKTVTIKNGSKGSTGSPGSNGVSATHSWSGTTLTITSASGTSSANLKGDKGDNGDSVKGDKGDPGTAGVSVSSVKQTTTSSADGGSNVITVTLSNGTTSTFTVKNGSKGSTGATGATGATGSKGADGKTPVKGTDYWTEADKESIVQDVITALGTPVFGTIDANKKITLSTEHLADGTYEVGYEDEDGNWVKIGTIDQGGLPYVNQIFKSIDTNGNIYNNGQGWKSGYRLNSSGGETALDGAKVTGFIPAVYGDEIYLENIALTPGTYVQGHSICLYDSNFAFIIQVNANTIPNSKYMFGEYQTDDSGYLSYIKLSDSSQPTAYIRVSSTILGENSIITVNEEIV